MNGPRMEPWGQPPFSERGFEKEPLTYTFRWRLVWKSTTHSTRYSGISSLERALRTACTLMRQKASEKSNAMRRPLDFLPRRGACSSLEMDDAM